MGYMEVLANKHAPLISTLKPGKLEVTNQDKNKKIWAVSAASEVLKNEVTLLADAVELPEEIDFARAEASLKSAREKIESKDPEVDVERAKKAVARAENRIKFKNSSLHNY